MDIEDLSQRQTDIFGNAFFFRRIMVYRWNDFVSNQQLLRGTESRPITSMVHQRQLRLYWYVARYLEADPASQVVSEKDNPG